MSNDVLKNIEQIVSAFEPVTLPDISASALLNRTDKKFLLPVHRIPELLLAIEPYYRVLNIHGKNIHTYETLYFDTPDFRLYREHHIGKPNRMKIRYRRYVTGDEVFFEIKHKLSGFRTGKTRIPRKMMVFELSAAEWELVHTNAKGIYGLEKKLNTVFERITLINKERAERVTIDTGLQFNNFTGTVAYPNTAIVEVKQNSLNTQTPVTIALRNMSCKQCSFSKYAIGTALLEQSVKHNLLKPAILQLQRTENARRASDLHI
jgi:hypothetical protein